MVASGSYFVNHKARRFDSTAGPWWDEPVLRKTFFGDPLILASGPRDAEAKLLSCLEDLVPRSPESFGPPVRIVVPSRSLRRHVLKALADRFGAVVGVVVQTHRALALEVLERGAVELPAGGARVQDLLARRFAAAEDGLRRDLSGFDDGYAPVAAAVRDLLDAGFGSEFFVPVTESVSASVPGPEGVRAAAVVRVAAKCHTAAETMGLAHRGTLHEWATRVLIERGEAALPSRAVLIYGFAEATGLLSDFLETLVRQVNARIVLDHPPDPVRPAHRDSGWVFTRRLLDRLAGMGSGEAALEPDSEALQRTIAAFTAPGPEAEVRETAQRIWLLMGQGVAPEDIGVTYRQIGPSTAAAVRRHFGRLGIPFSGEGAQIPGGALARRASALVEVLTLGPGARTESWLNAGAWSDTLKTRELDLALRTVGAARLVQVAALEVDEVVGPDGLRLPVVEGMDEVEGEDRKRRRVMARPGLEVAVAEAGALVRVLGERPRRATVGVFFDWVREVLEHLGRRAGVEEGDGLSRALDGLEHELPEALEIEWTEFAPLLTRSLEGLGAAPLSGQGGGVQVLTVMEARGRTFEHLFVLNLNRGVFPAQMADDPVFSTAARRAVTDLLLDLPLKERDRPEERYLFAQLMASAPSVTLSWQCVDAEGKELNPSVFVERLRLGEVLWWARDGEESEASSRECAQVDAAPDVFGRRPEESMRPPLEHAVVEGLEERGAGFSAAMGRLVDRDIGQLLAVLDELDPPNERCDLGPFLGVIGMRPPEDVWVTFVEAFAACPWKVFLERVLGLEAPPEASFSEESLGGAIVGSVVHEVLERVAVEQGVGSREGLNQVRGRQGVSVLWPDPTKLERITNEVARRKTVEIGVPALGPAVAQNAKGFLERARDLAWPNGEAMVLGVESIGQAGFRWQRFPSEREETTFVKFRADRVDPRAEGEGLILLDYMTGEPAGVSPKLAIARGRLLQGAAYVLGGGEAALGRYVVLKDVKKPLVEIDQELAGGVVEPVRAIFGSWAEGVFFPRLSDPDGKSEGDSCGWCLLKSACMHGDSGVRRRMVEAFDAMDEEAPLRLMWELPKKKADSASRSGPKAKA